MLLNVAKSYKCFISLLWFIITLFNKHLLIILCQELCLNIEIDKINGLYSWASQVNWVNQISIQYQYSRYYDEEYREFSWLKEGTCNQLIDTKIMSNLSSS